MLLTRSAAADSALVRAIGLRALTASIVNSTIGAGIFVLPAAVAAAVGPAAPFAYLACAVTMALIVTCFAMAGSRVSATGGIYAYADSAFGPYVGFLAGVMYWLSATFGVAAVAAALASALGSVMPAVAAAGGRSLFLVALFAAFAWLNVRGVRVGARAVEIGTLAKILPLAVFVLAGAFFVNPAAARFSLPDNASQVGGGVLTLIFAFVGIEVSLVPSGEIHDPARTVPRAVYLALGITTALYLAIQFVAQGLLGPALAQAADAPLSRASEVFLGRGGRSLMTAGAMVSMVGYILGDVLGSPRVLFAFGRDGMLPAALAYVHPRYRTPAVAIVLHAGVACALSLAGSLGKLLLIANVAVLSMYFVCCASAWQLARTRVQGEGAPFVAVGGAAIPVLACAAIAWILSQATREEFQVEGLVLAAASVLYGVMRLVHRRGAA
jgi:basic amino acid/polyamine antiporter, APA family